MANLLQSHQISERDINSEEGSSEKDLQEVPEIDEANFSENEFSETAQISSHGSSNNNFTLPSEQMSSVNNKKKHESKLASEIKHVPVGSSHPPPAPRLRPRKDPVEMQVGAPLAMQQELSLFHAF